MQGTVTPDEYAVFKPTLRLGFQPIIRRRLGTKESKLICGPDGGADVSLVPVPEQDRARFALGDTEVLQLARWACVIEEHYSAKRGRPTPLDLEWAKDGPDGELYFLQARPETVESRRDRNVLERYRIHPTAPPIVTGCSIGNRVAHGVVRVIPTAKDLQQFTAGEVLVTDRTDPDWEPILKRAAAVIKTIAEVIRVCRARGRKIGICGQAPSDYPEFVDFLIAQGIGSISLNPDTVLKMLLAVAERERAATEAAKAPQR